MAETTTLCSGVMRLHLWGTLGGFRFMHTYSRGERCYACLGQATFCDNERLFPTGAGVIKRTGAHFVVFVDRQKIEGPSSDEDCKQQQQPPPGDWPPVRNEAQCWTLYCLASSPTNVDLSETINHTGWLQPLTDALVVRFDSPHMCVTCPSLVMKC